MGSEPVYHTTLNYPNADLSAFSLWPDAQAVSEEMAGWAQTAGYAQQGLDEGIPLNSTFRMPPLPGDEAARPLLSLSTSCEHIRLWDVEKLTLV